MWAGMMLATPSLLMVLPFGEVKCFTSFTKCSDLQCSPKAYVLKACFQRGGGGLSLGVRTFRRCGLVRRLQIIWGLPLKRITRPQSLPLSLVCFLVRRWDVLPHRRPGRKMTALLGWESPKHGTLAYSMLAHAVLITWYINVWSVNMWCIST